MPTVTRTAIITAPVSVCIIDQKFISSKGVFPIGKHTLCYFWISEYIPKKSKYMVQK